MGKQRIRLEFVPWLSERLGGPAYRSRHLEWHVDTGIGETVGELFTRLATADDSFREAVFDPGTRHLGVELVVVLNDHLLDLAGGLETQLRDGDRLTVIPALAGG